MSWFGEHCYKIGRRTLFLSFLKATLDGCGSILGALLFQTRMAFDCPFWKKKDSFVVVLFFSSLIFLSSSSCFSNLESLVLERTYQIVFNHGMDLMFFLPFEYFCNKTKINC